MTAPSGLTPTPPPANKLQKSAVAEAEQASLSQKLEQPLPVTKITLFYSHTCTGQCVRACNTSRVIGAGLPNA